MTPILIGARPETPGRPPPRAIRRVIGLVGTLSGPGAWRGEDAFEGADVSVGDLNRKLSDEEAPFELVSLDDQGDPDRAVELVEELAQSPRTVGIVFGGPPEALPRTEDALAAAGIPAIVCYGDLYGARKLSAHIFQMSPSYLWEGRTLARYVANDRGYRTVGVMSEDSPDGRTATAALRQEMRRQGRRVPRTVTYDPADQQFRPDLRVLREAQVEALVVHGGPTVVATILADLRSMGIRYTGTADARVASAPQGQRLRRSNSRYWRPQVMALDLAISDETDQSIPVGMVASDTYRGALTTCRSPVSSASGSPLKVGGPPSPRVGSSEPTTRCRSSAGRPRGHWGAMTSPRCSRAWTESVSAAFPLGSGLTITQRLMSRPSASGRSPR